MKAERASEPALNTPPRPVPAGAGGQAQGPNPGYWPAWLVTGAALSYMLIQLLGLPATPVIDVSGLVAETLICLAPVAGLFVVQRLRRTPHIFWPLLAGLSFLLLSHLTDALDEVRVQPAIVGILIEDGMAVLGYGLLVLGLVRWLRFNQQLLAEIHALNAGLEQRVVARTAALNEEMAKRQRAKQRLQASEQRYRELNAVLEQRVAERTAELQAANDLLHEREAGLQQAREVAEAANRALLAANTELQRLATTDRLTGTWNRLRFDEAAVAEIERAARYGVPLSLLLFDIDHFKAINDTHGHLVGDQVLIELTQRVRRHLRSADVLARWGGEEFVVMLPHCGATEAMHLADKLRALVAEEAFAAVGKVTASFGVAEYRPGESFDDWLHRADVALYAAKAGGRNRVGVAEIPRMLATPNTTPME